MTIDIKGSNNSHEKAGVPPEKKSAHSRVLQPIQDEYMEKRWIPTPYPTQGVARRAEMSNASYEDFVWGAVNKDPEARRTFLERLVDRLDPAGEVRIVAGETTDLRMSVAGNHAANEYGQVNPPSGEEFTAPIPNSVEGTVYFDEPVLARGNRDRKGKILVPGWLRSVVTRDGHDRDGRNSSGVDAVRQEEAEEGINRRLRSTPWSGSITV